MSPQTLTKPQKENQSKSGQPAATKSLKPNIKARRFDVSYEQEVTKHWAQNDAFLTHWLNAYTMTIPGGETFIVKTMQHFLDQIKDPQLKKDAQGLIGQELSHSNGHMKFIDVIHRQGYSTRFYSAVTEFLTHKILEPTSTPLQGLAFIVGVERINELFAEITLGANQLATAPAEVRALYEWHLAEEIEHKCVVFDTYHEISGSRFWLKYGLYMSFIVNMAYLGFACATFLWQDRKLFSPSTWKSAWRYFFSETRFLPRMWKGLRECARKGFHPSQTDNRHLAEHVLKNRVISAA